MARPETIYRVYLCTRNQPHIIPGRRPVWVGDDLATFTGYANRHPYAGRSLASLERFDVHNHCIAWLTYTRQRGQEPEEYCTPFSVWARLSA